MSDTLVFVLGVGVGVVAARLLMEPSSCCARVADGVRDEVGDQLGGGAQAVGDLFGFWRFTPGLLDLFGVK